MTSLIYKQHNFKKSAHHKKILLAHPDRENYQCTQQEEFSIQGFDFVSKKCIDKENLATDENPKMDRR